MYDEIYEFVEDDAPCRNCRWYNNGRVYDDGSMFHEFRCAKGCCLHCAENNGFSCFENPDDDE